MALKDKWKDFGKNTGNAFKNFGKAIGKTAKVAFTDEKNEVEEGGGTTLGNAWRETGKSFGRAGKALGQAAEGTVEKVVGVDDDVLNGKQVILLNGPSSSGKSTLSVALQALLKERKNEEYPIVSIDSYLEMSKDKTIYEEDVFRITRGMYEKAVKEAQKAPGVIIDHVITSERIFKQFKSMLEPCKLLLVHVDCSLEELQKREAERPDRCPGSAEASKQYLYPQDGYDVTVDTSVQSTEECAEAIFAKLLNA